MLDLPICAGIRRKPYVMKVSDEHRTILRDKKLFQSNLRYENNTRLRFTARGMYVRGRAWYSTKGVCGPQTKRPCLQYSRKRRIARKAGVRARAGVSTGPTQPQWRSTSTAGNSRSAVHRILYEAVAKGRSRTCCNIHERNGPTAVLYNELMDSGRRTTANCKPSYVQLHDVRSTVVGVWHAPVLAVRVKKFNTLYIYWFAIL